MRRVSKDQPEEEREARQGQADAERNRMYKFVHTTYSIGFLLIGLALMSLLPLLWSQEVAHPALLGIQCGVMCAIGGAFVLDATFTRSRLMRQECLETMLEGPI